MKTIKIPELNIKVEKEIHHKGEKLSEIKIPKGWRLLKVDEIVFLFNNYEKELNMSNTWEFFEQPIKKFKGVYNARFYVYSDWAYLNCSRELSFSYSSLGVRFCRDIQPPKIANLSEKSKYQWRNDGKK